MSDFLQMAEDAGIREKETCKGLFFRGRVGTYRTYHPGNLYLAQKRQLHLLKRKSCPGCGQCECFWEWFDESEADAIDLGDIQDSKIYTPIFIIDGHDWEGGYVDDYHYEFREVSK